MDTRQVEKLLEEYAKHLPQTPDFTEQDIARFREHLAEVRETGADHDREPKEEPAGLSRRRLIWSLVGVTGLAAAAVIVLVFVLPPSEVSETPIILDFDVRVNGRWPSTTRGLEGPPTEDPGGFTIHVSTSSPRFVHIITLMESGDLLVKPVVIGEERSVYSRRVEQGDSIGEYPLWYDPEDDSDRGLIRTTHVMVVAAGEPIVRELADAVPDHIVVESSEGARRKLDEIGQRLEEELGCVVVVRAVEPTAP